jgi:hypothetical protein
MDVVGLWDILRIFPDRCEIRTEAIELVAFECTRAQGRHDVFRCKDAVEGDVVFLPWMVEDDKIVPSGQVVGDEASSLRWRCSTETDARSLSAPLSPVSTGMRSGPSPVS